MHAFAATAVLFSCILGLTRAAPTRGFTGCDISRDIIPLPAGQTALTVPKGRAPIAITLGVGTQNYTCSDGGNYTSIGAVAVLYDASCPWNVINSIATKSNEGTNRHNEGNRQDEGDPFLIDEDLAVEGAVALKATDANGPLILGHHYFVKNPTAAGVTPAFDFRANSEIGNPNAFVITSKVGDIVAPQNPSVNADWLELAAIPGHGDLATNVFRILTLGGQPPQSCPPGSTVAVPYAAYYWFFK